MKSYPLKFKPKFQYRIWGGDKLKSVLKKDYSQSNIGESWEISCVPKNETMVENGVLKGFTINELIEKFGANFLGHSVVKKFGYEFPLLIKFIDAREPLSIQVHPNDELAKERHNSFGKNEMWYIMDSELDSSIIVGFNKQLNKEDYIAAIQENKIESFLNSISVSKGDTFFIPAGRVHAIGAGVLIAEIQQTSDVTYRIYDFNRVDKNTGLKRELHTDLSVAALDFDMQDNYKTLYETSKVRNTLVHTPYFKTDILIIKGQFIMEFKTLNSFKILMCVEGNSTISHLGKDYSLHLGESILLPADIQGEVVVRSEQARILEVYF